MKRLLFILGTELYTEVQIQDAVKIVRVGGYNEILVPTPDGISPLSGKIPHSTPLTTFKCAAMIIPSGVLTKTKDNYHTTSKGIHLTFCDLIDTWRCELNRAAARDAGFECEVLKQGRMVRRVTPGYEYSIK